MRTIGFPFAHHLMAASALAALHAGASAQATAPEAGKLSVVTVTAERRIENIQAVPVSASVVQGELLDVLNTSGQDVRMLSARVPSLNIESSFGRAFPRFYIRGYGNTDFRLNASQPVSLVYDDVVQENPILKGFPAFDLERVEVLRGPQGTLFGRNTPAGVVKFESVKPGKKFEGYGSLSFGTYSTVNAEGAINVPLNGDTSIRISLLNQTRSNWVHNTFAAGLTQDLEGYRDSAIRAQLLYQPNKDVSALFNVHLRDLNGSARVFRANIIKPGTNDFTDDFDIKKVRTDGKNESKLKTNGANARLRFELGGDVSLNSITGYESLTTFNRGDIDGGAPPYNFSGGAGSIPFLSETADGMPTHRQLTQELRLESNNRGPFNWQAGIFYFQEDYKIESFDYDSSAGSVQDGYERVRQKNDAYALFGNVNFAVTPDLQLRGGLRYTRDKKKFNVEDYTWKTFAACFDPGLGANTRCTLAELAKLGPLSSSPSDSKVNWDLSATWSLDKSTNLYARAGTGFRGSSVQGAGAFNDLSTAKPENNTSIEAGIKADLFNRRARINFGVFSYSVTDLQLTAVGGAGNANILLNAKKATGTGYELDLQALVSDNLLATLSLGYNDTKIKDPGLAVSPCNTAQYVFGQPGAPRPNCTVTNPMVNGKALIDGNPLPQAPKVTSSFTLRYTQPMGSGDAYLFTDWVYRDKVNFFLYQSTEFTGKALLEGGLRGGYTWGNGKYDVAAFVRNMTNQIRIVGGIDFDNLTGFVNEPRTYGVQFKASF